MGSVVYVALRVALLVTDGWAAIAVAAVVVITYFRMLGLDP